MRKNRLKCSKEQRPKILKLLINNGSAHVTFWFKMKYCYSTKMSSFYTFYNVAMCALVFVSRKRIILLHLK